MRKHYLDNIRWITIILVVIFHIYYYYNNIGTEAMFLGLPDYKGNITFGGIYQYFVYPWFMVLLFVVAGISAKHALEKRNNKQFLKSRVDKILVPSTLGILAFGWIGGYIIYLHTVSANAPEDIPFFFAIIITLSTGIGALWFCQVLFVATLCLMVVRFIIKKCHSTDEAICKWFVKKMESPVGFLLILVVLYLILWGGSHILNMPVITAYRNGIYISAFLMGYYIFSNDKIIERLKKLVVILFIATIATGGFYIYRCYGLYYADINVLSRFDLNLYAFCMVLLALGAAAKFLDYTNPFMDYMKKCCFGIYVFHIPVLLVTNFFLIGSGFSMAVIYIIELISAIICSVLLYEIIRRVPILRYWILGIRKKK